MQISHALRSDNAIVCKYNRILVGDPTGSGLRFMRDPDEAIDAKFGVPYSAYRYRRLRLFLMTRREEIVELFAK